MNNEPFNLLFDRPVKPGLKELQWLADGKDGFINLLKDDDKHAKLVPLAAIPQAVISKPESCIPGIVEWFQKELATDSYATINGFYRPYNNSNELLHKPIKEQGLQSKLRWLNAVYIDLDIYKAGITHGEAWKQVIEMMDARIIPPVSWIKNSGQGLWLFWALHPTRYWNEKPNDSFPKYKRILRQLNLIFKELESDRQAVDATRVSRIYGSRNHKSGTLVSLWQRTDQNGNMARYDLDELEVFFGTYSRQHNFRDYDSSTLYEIDDEQQEPLDVDAHRRKLGKLGSSARFDIDLERFWALVETVRRKRIKQGTRNKHVAILAAILQHVFINRKYNNEQRAEAIQAAANRLWNCFQDTDSYDLASVERQLVSSIELRREHNCESALPKIKHRTISDTLNITTEEAAQVADLVPGKRKCQFWPPATGQLPFRLTPKPKAEQQQARREFIARAYDGKPRPDYRTLAAVIQQATGLDCSHTTAKVDWQAVFPDKPPTVKHTEFTFEDRPEVANSQF